ncbi:trehalase-like [Manis pentadactyla]|uniref:trehalase-like n=1 Tax=Manis pentadactyla TaxID=143292 RepID=UPI00255C7FA5|nr:trehalase-like [Manis pentadactyla]
MGEETGAWFDYCSEHGRILEFYPSNHSPLWVSCFSELSILGNYLKYLEANQILTYRYGVPTSLQKTGQQWDFPNAWAPLQDLVIRGLAKSPSPRTQEVAFQLAQNWILTNFDVYSKKSAMYEKYDISSDGQPGGGGEYEVQVSGPTCPREPQGSAVPTTHRDLPKLGLAPPPVWSTGSVAVLPGTPGGLAGTRAPGWRPTPALARLCRKGLAGPMEWS